MFGLTVALAASWTWLALLNRFGEPFFKVVGVVTMLGCAAVGGLIASRHPRNPIGWLFFLIALAVMIGALTEEYAIRGFVTAPGSLPSPTLALWIANWVFIPALVSVPLILLLFPTGRVLSRRWRLVASSLVVSGLVMVLGFVLQPRNLAVDLPGPVRQVRNPTGVQSLADLIGPVLTAGVLVSLAAAFASVVALFLRFRRSSSEERQQLKWLLYVAAAAAAFLAGNFVVEPILGEDSVLNTVSFVGFFLAIAVGIPGASAIAILKYRLYDLDLVVKKTVVFAALVAFITLVYVAVVVGVGALVGERGNTLLTFVATAIVAIAFQPARDRARRLADRMVYGKRATPYEVLSEFSDRVSETYSTEDVLPRMARILAAGTGAARADIWLRIGSELRPTASWPTGPGGPTEALLLPGSELPQISGSDRFFHVRHRGELLGALTVEMPASEPLTPAHEKLIQHLAAQAGLVLQNVRLIEELRASRQRLVRAQDEERRRLERNIHDGAQQQLVALAVKLGLAEKLVERDAARTRELLAEIRAQTSDALQDLRDLARGIYPPLLADKGLPAALEAQARRAPLPVRVEADGVGRQSQEAEAAVYFCVLEALQNVAKYAEASQATVRLDARDGQLEFEVADDGKGFHLTATSYGTGLQGMADRLEAIGGRLDVRSAPDAGTTVIGAVPVGSSAEGNEPAAGRSG